MARYEELLPASPISMAILLALVAINRLACRYIRSF